MEVRIKQGNEMLDATIEMVDGMMIVSPKVDKFVPKDGDVVCQGKNYVLIYKDCMTIEAHDYASLFVPRDRLTIGNDGHIGYITTLRPATEEEKKKLFDKLAEEGYKFDFEKKELVKLKWKPDYGEVYWCPSASIVHFKPLYSIWRESALDLDRFESGWCFKTKEECQAFCDRLNDAINSVKPNKSKI